MEQGGSHSSVALVVGVTGMVGLALVEALKKPTAPRGPWKVYGTSRRPLPTWFPPYLLDHYITLDAINSQDTHEKLSPLSSQVTHLFWLAYQFQPTEELQIDHNSILLKNVLNTLTKSSTSSKLSHVTLQTGTKHYMGPISDSSLQDQLVPHETPFKEEYPRLPFPNFYYALEDLIASHSPTFTYSIHRSSIIIGSSTRSFYNTLLTICVYATICKHEGMKFRFPGSRYTWEHFCDMSDARVLAEQQIWAAVNEKAKNQAFNCTNGDVFTWKSFWRKVCNVFEVGFIPFDEKDQKFVLSEVMKDKGKVWDHLVEKYGLYETKMEEITCFDALQLVMQFDFQHVCSMNKSREFGFLGFANTLESVGFWVERLRKMKIIP